MQSFSLARLAVRVSLTLIHLTRAAHREGKLRPGISPGLAGTSDARMDTLATGNRERKG